MKTTLNGQFFVAYLVYQLMTKLTTATLIQINTDGVTIKVHESEVEAYKIICSTWEKTVKLKLEYAEYDKMYVADVNNYGARKISENWKRFDNPQYKYKGRFELELDEDFLHKDRSYVVVRRALAAYFWSGKDPMSYLQEQDQIWDFLARQKFDKSSVGYLGTTKAQKVTRYYVSTDGVPFMKKYLSGKSAGKTQRIVQGYVVTECNELLNTSIPSNLNYKYYLERVRKEIYAMESGQHLIFNLENDALPEGVDDGTHEELVDDDTELAD